MNKQKRIKCIGALVCGLLAAGCAPESISSMGLTTPALIDQLTSRGLRSAEIGRHYPRATAYFPDSSPMQGGYLDARGKPLQTLQAYLRGQARYVSLAMDLKTIPYGTVARIPELERDYAGGKQILFGVVDTGGSFIGTHGTRVDVCVEKRADAYDPRIGNRTLTVILLSGALPPVVTSEEAIASQSRLSELR